MSNGIYSWGNPNAPIVVVVDPPSKTANSMKQVMIQAQLVFFAKVASAFGFSRNDFVFVNASPFMPDEVYSSDAKSGRFLNEYKPSFMEQLASYNPRMIMTMGKLAARQIVGRPIQITKVRGQISNYENFPPVLHTLGIGHVLKSPQYEPTLLTDFQMLRKFVDCDFNPNVMALLTNTDYQWCTDLTDWINDPPRIISFDTETTGLDAYKPEVYPFTVQLSRAKGSAIMIPVARHYHPELERDHDRLMRQLKWILENANILKTAHNIKFDYLMLKKLRIVVEGWKYDSMLMAFNVDENMRNKGLDECIRRWIPEMAGYADAFNNKFDKDRMIEIAPADILPYGCGDADGALRLAAYLQTELAKDKRQMKVMNVVQMSALRAFADTLETNGVPIDTSALEALGDELAASEVAKYDELIRRVPGAVKRKHLDMKKPLAFSRDDFVRDVLFTPEGFNLKPKIYTKSTKRLALPDRVVSVSSKDHLPYFKDFEVKGRGGQPDFKFVERLIDYQKLQKMRNTYIGFRLDPEKGVPTGFWKYIYNGRIFPTYNLHKTVTGRTSSDNPNGQNIPKRGEYAKAYRKIFVAPEGWSLIQADYSQAELRLIAWMANEPTMLEAYMSGKDLHAVRASMGKRMTYEAFMALSEDDIEDGRYRAKAQNFGLCYKMSPPGYKEYAYTGYNLILSLEEAESEVSDYYKTFRALEPWHEAMIEIAREKGYVRALHGAKRNLPDIRSEDPALRALAERQAINSPIQRFASDLGLMALGRIARDLAMAPTIPLFPVMFIHDALVFLCRNDYLQDAMSAIKYYMESNPLQEYFDLTPPIPILCDLEAGPSLGTLTKHKTVIAARPDWYTYL